MGHPQPHIPVLVGQVIEALALRPGGVYVDATVGFGGHAEAILSGVGPEGMVLGIDRDPDALAWCRRNLGNARLVLLQGRFSQMESLLGNAGVSRVDGVLFDLGVSLHQLKDLRRGFSFLSPDRLDMRMDPQDRVSAWEVVNTYPEREMERILREYGEERQARKIARAIVAQRRSGPIGTCAELAELVSSVCRRQGRIHPATRTFQALRMEVNSELEELRAGLEAALRVMKGGGRLCVISYHSLEDRIVKNFMREGARAGLMRVVTKKPVTPPREETLRNPPSRSAKLRGAEKA